CNGQWIHLSEWPCARAILADRAATRIFPAVMLAEPRRRERECADDVSAAGGRRADDAEVGGRERLRGSGGAALSARLKQILKIERPAVHRQFSLRGARPVFGRAIPIQLKAILIRIAQIKRFADAVVAGAVKRNLGSDQSSQRVAERGAPRIQIREV